MCITDFRHTLHCYLLSFLYDLPAWRDCILPFRLDVCRIDPTNVESLCRVEMESISVLGRGRQELSRHTHTLQSFSIDGEYNVFTVNENLFISFIKITKR